MSEGRLKLNIPKSGSAARLAEQQAASPPRLHVSAGSAARLAENEKREEARAGNSFPGGSAGFSLRANGRNVVRESFDPAAGIVRNSEAFSRANPERPSAEAPEIEAPPVQASSATMDGDVGTSPRTSPAEGGGLLSNAAQNFRRLFRS